MRQCAAAIIQRGIGRIVVAMSKDLPETWAKKWELASTMFSEAGIAVCILPPRKRAKAKPKANDNALRKVS